VLALSARIHACLRACSVEMPSKKHYDLVSDDGLDCRIPLYSEEAFRHGLQFQAKVNVLVMS